MKHLPFTSAIRNVLRGELQDALPAVERAVEQHPGWVTPVVAMAVAAERIEDWERAFELWSQARTLLPDSEKIGVGVRRASLMLLRQATPEKHSSPVGEPPAVDETWGHSTQSEDAIRETESEPPSVEDTPSPSPLIAPLDFDLTDIATDPSFSVSAVPPPPGPVSDASSALDELDELIGRLEGARIVPRQDADSIPSPDLEADIEDVASETLAVIYLDQEQFSEAARVFEKLANQHPDRADEFLGKAHEARARVSD